MLSFADHFSLFKVLIILMVLYQIINFFLHYWRNVSLPIFDAVPQFCVIVKRLQILNLTWNYMEYGEFQ